jgi:lysophospholipase L1-like esterase
MALVLLEVSLQLAAAANAWVRNDGSSPTATPARDGVFRVLCLGESTTAQFFGVPYPALLERRLNRRGYGLRFEVINAGRPGTHTADLVARLPALVDEHRPALVILMMGVNDHLYFDDPAHSLLPLALQRGLSRFRTYRVLRLLMQRIEAPAADPIDEAHLARFEARARSIAERVMQGAGSELEAPLRELIRAAREAPVADPDARLVGVSQPYLHAYQRAHESLAGIYLAEGRADDAVALLEEAVARHPRARFFRVELARLHLRLGRPERAEPHFEEARQLAEHRALATTRDNYRAALDLLRERGIAAVAMQYPLRSLASLRELLGEPPDVWFVDNEESFRDAVARRGYDAVFRDRFAGDFGHWDALGNRIVVSNLIAQVFDPLLVHAGSPPAGRARER